MGGIAAATLPMLHFPALYILRVILKCSSPRLKVNSSRNREDESVESTYMVLSLHIRTHPLRGITDVFSYDAES